MVQHLLGRTGPRRFADIRPEVLDALNQGLIPTVHLTEFLAVDLALLASRVAARIGLDPQHERLQDTLAMLPSFKPMRRHGLIARALHDMTAGRPDRDAIAQALADHVSDIARGWAAQWPEIAGLPLPQRLQSLRRFAADSHFGVREMAWMAARDAVERDLDAALALLQPWVLEDDERLRRFAIELTRPHGVWCAPLRALKAQPWRALPLLEPVRADPSLYVRKSVGNWLNDAARTQPDWVLQLCAQWRVQSPHPHTLWITTHGQRGLRRAGLTPP